MPPEPTPTHERIDVPGIGTTTVAIWLAELIRANERARIAAKLREQADLHHKRLYTLPCIAIGREHVASEMATYRSLADQLDAGTL